ncbi:hypothetical protein BDB00DRAFT_772160 [Zychaea mexicana]|uniref:uncharacterized protein n=1 Tax=Zychaea mexicana TaxID=64656 RepID=UPI0022FF0062|nr:uncharacterized protein BDB00DRAFT_772160 [Zychaea mexicana]KAI9488569.1 hypothetical protein BDB00DRAFT_772160 [Zychaea mexicana]
MVTDPIVEATLMDGTTIAVNDHVYLAPEHLGETYYIGRVMEFCGNSKRRGLQARIAWYNRPRDVISRKNHDPRLLVATMHSDLNPVSSIRGKCTVTHRHYIPAGQLEQYKQQDDCFYYHQLYDRYMQRVYDIVPCELVQNVPKDVQTALRERYQFIVVEQGKASDLTVARRTCCVCQDWCASASSVRCAACQKNYHMACLNPPLLRKPSKGFAWQCAFCSRKEIMEAPTASSHTNTATSSSLQTTTTTTTSAAEAEAEAEAAAPTSHHSRDTRSPSTPASRQRPTRNAARSSAPRMTNMWPFRYFGIHTDIHDILDIDDRIYPRARSRLGARYQADPIPDLINAPSSNNGDAHQNHQPSSPAKSASLKLRPKPFQKRTRPRSRRRTEGSPNLGRAPSEEDTEEPGPIERGTDATITPLFHPNRLDDQVLNQYIKDVKALPSLPLPPYSGDLLDRAILCLEHNDYDTKEALEEMRKVDESDFVHIVEWTPEEVEAFESGIKTYGHDLYHVGRMVPSKKHADVVRYFYQWKKTERYEPVYSQWTKVYKPTKKFKKFGNNVSSEGTDEDSNNNIMQIDSGSEMDSGEESDPTVIHASSHMVKTFHCANCQSPDSTIWRRLPTDVDRKRKHFRQVLCNDCGEFWLKYGIMRKTSVERTVQRGKGRGLKTNGGDAAANSKGGAKRKRTNDGGATKFGVRKLKDDKRVVSVSYEPTPCAVCSEMEPQERLLTCHGCGMSVHGDCYGAHKSIKEAWYCDVCINKKNPTASYSYECILCSESRQSPRQPLKKTSSYNWVHVLCAMFIPEVKFVNIATLQPAEYIAAINKARWNETCHLCKEQTGACVVCGDCNKPVHVQCAIKHNFTVAFEVQSPKASRSGVTIPADLFRSNMPSGLMVPQVWCPNHDLSKHQLVRLTERTTDTNVSCTRIYSSYYKQVESGTTPAMRRYRAVLASTGHPYSSAIYNPSSLHSESSPTLSPASIPSARQSVLSTMPPARQPTTTTTTATSSTSPLSLSSSSSTNRRTPVTTALASVPIDFNEQPKCSECPAEFSPYWWDVDASPDKKLCHRCYWRHKRDNNTVDIIAPTTTSNTTTTTTTN